MKGRCILLLTESHDFEVMGCTCGHGNIPQSIFVEFFLRNSLYCGCIGITLVLLVYTLNNKSNSVEIEVVCYVKCKCSSKIHREPSVGLVPILARYRTTFHKSVVPQLLL